MKVAIMGAGLSGLACAIELERHGIQPAIFENRSQVGDRFINGEVFAAMFSRPIMDEIRYLSENHGIFVQPASNISELVLYSANNHASIIGPIGFVSIRGRHGDSLENQLARQVQSEIQFNSQQSYEDLVREYTHVVVATGDAAYAERFQPFELGVTVTLKGVTAEGEFSRFKVMCWFDNQFAPHGGYGFLIPFSEKEATVVLAFPEYRGLAAYDKEELWRKYFERVTKDLDQSLKVTDAFEINRYMIGICKYPRIGNTFFVGNCFGALMPFLGFGQFSSILTGIYAAQDICGSGKYEQLTAPLRRSYYDSLALRRFLETLDNAGMDKLVQLLNGFWGHKLVHSKVNALRWASYAARLWLAMPKFRRETIRKP
jgi:flavin-dependent dehydrogenase